MSGRQGDLRDVNDGRFVSARSARLFCIIDNMKLNNKHSPLSRINFLRRTPKFYQAGPQPCTPAPALATPLLITYTFRLQITHWSSDIHGMSFLNKEFHRLSQIFPGSIVQGMESFLEWNSEHFSRAPKISLET